jgi:hypothetical protein
MTIIEESRSLLESAGYRTALSNTHSDQFYFEDACILGAVFVHPDVASLLDNWQAWQDRFLGTHSQTLRLDPIKAWNIYTVHLTSETGTGAEATKAFNIEQDFRGTRKIARIGVTKRADVKEALLPLLSLQTRLILSSQRTTERVRERLALSSAVIVRVLEKADDTTIALDLMEEK